MRAFAAAEPETYFSESFLQWNERENVSDEAIAVRRKQGLWQAEMYGYVFGAARANVSRESPPPHALHERIVCNPYSLATRRGSLPVTKRPCPCCARQCIERAALRSSAPRLLI